MHPFPTIPRLAHVAGVLLIACLAAALYLPALAAPFVLDDHRNIVDNDAVHLSELTLRGFARAIRESPSPRPLANVSFALDHYLWGAEVRGYRAVNIAIHVLNGGLVYAFLLALGRCDRRRPSRGAERGPDASVRWVALVAALVFVAHPLQTQSVTYVVQRMTILCTTFYLSALLCYLGARTGPDGRRRLALLLAGTLAWIAALLTKQIAATLPIAVILLEWFFLQDLDRGWPRRNARWLVGGGTGMVLAAGTYLALVPHALDYTLRDFTLGERVLTQLRVVVLYLSLLAFPDPARLNLTHQIHTSHSLFDPPSTLVCLLLLLGLLVLAVRLAPRRRVAAFCILWFFLQLAIESSVFPLEMVFEHRLYLPMVGVALLAATAFGQLEARRRRLGTGVAVLVVALLAAGTVARHRTWRDPITLWSDVVAKSPDGARGYNNLGYALERDGRIAEAADAFSRAVALDPDYARAHHNLAEMRMRQGQVEEADRHYREVLRIHPDDAFVRTNLALSLESRGRSEEASVEAEGAVRSVPEFAEGQYVAGSLLVRRGRFEAAIPYLAEAARLDRDHVLARYTLGIALMRLGRLDEALRPLAEAVRLDPSLPYAQGALGDAYARVGDRERARAHLARALRLDPGLDAARERLERLDTGR